MLGGAPEAEPVYGPTYLPRKFKMEVAVPPDNDVDVFAQDLGFIAIVERGTITGYNVVAGGGMGATHGEPETYPRVGDVIGYCPVAQLIEVAEAVLMTQRDFGDRANRKHARLKYTIDTHGLQWLKNEVDRRMMAPLAPARPFSFTTNRDPLGWTTDNHGLHHLTVYVENGRIGGHLKRALAAIAALEGYVDTGTFVFTANQNLIIANADDGARTRIDALLATADRDDDDAGRAVSALRAGAMACVALPTCGLALAESERYLPGLVTKLEDILAVHDLAAQPITIRMTGCPNGCARPYIAEIGLVGRGPGRYNLLLGGAADGSRLNAPFRDNATEAEILASLEPVIAAYAGGRHSGEGFGDYVRRAGIVG